MEEVLHGGDVGLVVGLAPADATADGQVQKRLGRRADEHRRRSPRQRGDGRASWATGTTAGPGGRRRARDSVA